MPKVKKPKVDLSKTIINATINNKDGIVIIDLPIKSDIKFMPIITYLNKPPNAQEVVKIIESNGIVKLDIKIFDISHFTNSAIPFDCNKNPITIMILLVEEKWLKVIYLKNIM